MNIFNKVTLKHLVANKSRTLVTIIGVVLSAALITAVTTSISSAKMWMLESMIEISGDWHGVTKTADGSVRDILDGSPEVDGAAKGYYLGYAEAEGCENPDKPYIFVMGADELFFERMPVNLISGRLPEKEDELVLPEHLALNGSVYFSLGDEVTLPLGNRVSDAYSLWQSNPFAGGDEDGVPGEGLEVRETRTYTVVGFCERPDFEPYTAPGYTALTVAPTGDIPAEMLCDAYFCMKEPKVIFDFIERNELNGDTNDDVLIANGVSKHNSFYEVLYSLAAIVLVLVVFGSVALIYNAFAISVSERTKQFGLLSSIGATKRQLRRSVLFEAAVISLVGIPVGLLVGIVGIGVTLTLIGDSFAFLAATSMHLSVSPLSIVIAVLIALVTVFISAWIPSRRAMRVTAIEAIRMTSDVKLGKGKSKTYRVTYKLFGLPGVLAKKYYKRSKKKYRATVVSLFMSIVLFVSASSFTGYIRDSISDSYATPNYDIAYSYHYEGDSIDESSDALALLSILSDSEYVTEGTLVARASIMITVPKEMMNEDFAKKYFYSASSDEDYLFGLGVNFIDDASFRRLCEQAGVNADELIGANEPTGLLYDNYYVYSPEEDKYVRTHYFSSSRIEATNYDIPIPEGYDDYYTNVVEDERVVAFYKREDGEGMNVPFDEAATPIGSLRSAAELKEAPMYMTEGEDIVLIYPYSLCGQVLGCDPAELSSMMYFTADDHKAAFSDLKRLLSEMHIDNRYSLRDVREGDEESRNIVLIVDVFAYGFIILISLISVANVLNTVSTNIALRRRDFAMLKSVGMSSKSFNRMMNYECLMYGSKALLLGLPVSAVFSFLIYSAMRSGFDPGFTLPWAAIGISVLSVFAVVFATMMYSMRKVRREDPIEALKNENL